MPSNSVPKEQTHKKRKTPSSSSSSQSSPLSSLPDELALSCLARVSRSDHVALSRVSKTHRSLVTSPELYETRSLLRCTENCLYVCMRRLPDQTPLWFILLRRPDGNRYLSPIPSFQSQTPEESSVRALAPDLYLYGNRFLSTIPPFQSHPREGSAVVALGSGIYVIGGLVSNRCISNVLYLDFRTHKWRELPSMEARRCSAAAGVVSGKIYVFGGCPDPDSSNWAELFDPETETWDPLLPEEV